MIHEQKILIIDFGSQYTQLIARRIRESKVYCEIHPHHFDLKSISDFNPTGIILSGGPMSIYDEGSPTIDSKIFQLGKPILGICYGLQLISSEYNGKVEPAKNREYGKADLEVLDAAKIFKDVKSPTTVWMSHGDYVTKVPENFEVIARTTNSPVCAIADLQKNIFGVQFHPEVVHSVDGKKIIENFPF